MEESVPVFCIGQHESRRMMHVSSLVIQRAHEANYDLVTSPITTPHFHSRVLALLSSALSQIQNASYDSQGSLSRSCNVTPPTIPPLSPVDTPLSPDESMSQIIAMSSSWIDLCSPDPLIASLSHQVLRMELSYAAFCGISYVLIPGPKLHQSSAQGAGIISYARAILDGLSAGPYMQVHIWLPMIDHPENDAEEMGDLAPFARQQYAGQGEENEPARKLDLFGTWEAWDTIRSLCKYHSRLCVALSIPKLMPPIPSQSRWHSEPVRVLTLLHTSFTKNAKGYPVLSKPHQAFISRLMRLRTPPWLILCDVGPVPGVLDSPKLAASLDGTGGPAATPMNTAHFPTPAEAFTNSQPRSSLSADPTPHLSYMRNLQTKQPRQTQLERFGAGYQDYLQAPLQPLTVNLESITYEVFEKDPVKYDWYEKAIVRALHDWIEQGKPTSNPDGRVVVAVVGAGRGPLVRRALQASEDVGVEIDMWALEKNPNAFVLLQRHNELIWDSRVNLVQSDMRTWKGPLRLDSQTRIPLVNDDVPIGQAISPEPSSVTQTTNTNDYKPIHYQIDILISELLGSFADNELSPECLDGVEHLLNPIHGISIPASYTAHLTPIAAPKLHADIMAQSISNPHAPEIPYVVMLHAVDYLSTTQALPSSMTNNNMRIPSTPPTANKSSNAKPQTKASTTADQQQHPQLPPLPYVQTAWSFDHPSLSSGPMSSSSDSSSSYLSSPPPITNAHNARSVTLSFRTTNRGICHGLAGYFEAVLYGSVELSTNPATMDAKSEGMISWFPIFFPLKTPLFTPDNGELVVSMWRQTDDRKVWYEWLVEAYAHESSSSSSSSIGGSGAIDGATGSIGERRFKIGASELHSSIKEACLM